MSFIIANDRVYTLPYSLTEGLATVAGRPDLCLVYCVPIEGFGRMWVTADGNTLHALSAADDQPVGSYVLTNMRDKRYSRGVVLLDANASFTIRLAALLRPHLADLWRIPDRVKETLPRAQLASVTKQTGTFFEHWYAVFRPSSQLAVTPFVGIMPSWALQKGDFACSFYYLARALAFVESPSHWRYQGPERPIAFAACSVEAEPPAKVFRIAVVMPMHFVAQGAVQVSPEQVQPPARGQEPLEVQPPIDPNEELSRLVAEKGTQWRTRAFPASGVSAWINGSGACDRCGSPASAVMMSYFNTDMLCMDCETKERAHPRFVEALAAELAETRAGRLNFAGIGLPADLKPQQPL